MKRASWKAAERAVARLFGGKRIPVTGRAGPDISHKWLSIEVKSRSGLPQYLWNWMRQAEDGMAPNKLPIVVLHRARRNHLQDDLVVMRVRDFLEWFGGGDEG
jgi:hypothetical protein